MSPSDLYIGCLYAGTAAAAAALYLAAPVTALLRAVRARWAAFTDLSNLDLGECL